MTQFCLRLTAGVVFLFLAGPAPGQRPGAGPSPHGYSGVYVGGSPGGTHTGDRGVYQGGWSGSTHSGYEGVYQGGYPGDYYRDRGTPSYRGIYDFDWPVDVGTYPDVARRARPRDAHDRTVLPRPAEDDAVTMDVRVPADAEIWIDGDKTTQRGTRRQFVSPPLTPGDTYVYEIRARWTQDGRTIDRTQKVRVRPGDRVRVDFTSDRK